MSLCFWPQRERGKKEEKAREKEGRLLKKRERERERERKRREKEIQQKEKWKFSSKIDNSPTSSLSQFSYRICLQKRFHHVLELSK